MILSEIKHYLIRNRRAAIADIANRFDVEPDTVRAMLKHWIRKGRVRKLSAVTSCQGGCTKCDLDAVEIYEWVDTPEVAR
jgi:DeoR/GlpR family transcriptional regulator of sugar metabolism